VEIYKDVFPEDQLHIIRNEDSLSLPADLDVVFDFGGWVDERVESIAKVCDVVIVPLFYQSMADLMPCIKTVNTLKGLNKNVVILINNTDKKDIDDLKKGLNKKFHENKIFVVNKSKFISRLANEGKTITRLASENALNRYLLRDLLAQMEDFYNYLDKF
jgi:Icc-related predicted phosphoesterase